MRLLTLLDGFRETTISECTFGVLSEPFVAALTALKMAESNCRRDTTYK